MRVRSLAGRLLVLQLTVVAVTVAAGALITVLVARERTETAARDRSLTVARTVAALPDVPQALRARDPSATLQPLAERVRKVAHVDFVTIMRPDGIRYTHPTPSLIGRRFVGTYAPAARGETVVETSKGTLGRSVRAVVPVEEDGRVVALVAVGVLTDAIGDEVTALLPGLLGLAAVIAAIGGLLSLLLARRLKRQTLGLEPQEIATLYAHHDATLHALERASWSSTKPAAPRSSTTTPSACWARTCSTLEPGELRDDAPLIAGDRVLLASSRAVERDGRRVGTVVTLRDRTEVETLARELGAVKALADALRAQTHEAANRLHVIAGLVELGRSEEAIELAGSEAASAAGSARTAGGGDRGTRARRAAAGQDRDRARARRHAARRAGRAAVRRLPADRARDDRRQPRRQRARGARPRPRRDGVDDAPGRRRDRDDRDPRRRPRPTRRTCCNASSSPA